MERPAVAPDLELYTVPQVAVALEVSPDTVLRWIRTHELHAIAFRGRAGYRVSRADLDAFLQHRREVP